MLLAMKLLVNRGVRDRGDRGDIALLLDACEVSGLADAQAFFESYAHRTYSPMQRPAAWSIGWRTATTTDVHTALTAVCGGLPLSDGRARRPPMRGCYGVQG